MTHYPEGNVPEVHLMGGAIVGFKRRGEQKKKRSPNWIRSTVLRLISYRITG
jgi:hypothetical protein